MTFLFFILCTAINCRKDVGKAVHFDQKKRRKRECMNQIFFLVRRSFGSRDVPGFLAYIGRFC